MSTITTTYRICEYGWDEDANVMGCPKAATRAVKVHAEPGTMRTTHLCREHAREILSRMNPAIVVEYHKRDEPATVCAGRTEGFY
jgi:hypothetical protein